VNIQELAVVAYLLRVLLLNKFIQPRLVNAMQRRWPTSLALVARLYAVFRWAAVVVAIIIIVGVILKIAFCLWYGWPKRFIRRGDNTLGPKHEIKPWNKREKLFPHLQIPRCVPDLRIFDVVSLCVLETEVEISLDVAKRRVALFVEFSLVIWSLKHHA
jgi:hypothetical protein